MNEIIPVSLQKKYAIVLILVLSCAVYLNSIYGDYLLDDGVLIKENPIIHSLWNVDLITYRWTRTYSYAIDYFFWGENPLGYHLSNIIYNALTVMVVFLLTRRLTGAFMIAFMTALVFALHPIHTETVSYLSGRRDILSALFYLLGFNIYLRARVTKKWGQYFLVILCYLSGISAKEMAITLPLTIFFYEVLQSMQKEQASKGSLIYEFFLSLWSNIRKYQILIIFMAVLMSGYLYVVLFIQHASGMVTAESIKWWGGTPLSNFATTTCVILAYLQKLLFPIVLHVSYFDFPRYGTLLHQDVILSLMVILILLGISIATIRRNWKITFLIWFFFISFYLIFISL